MIIHPVGVKSRFLLLALPLLLLLASVSAFAAEPLTGSSEAVTVTAYIKVIVGLLFVIGLFLIATYLFKRYGNGPMLAKGQMKIIDGLHISNKERLVLVELKGRQLLLAITPGSITKIDTLYSDLDAANGKEPSYELMQAAAERSQV